MEPFKSYNNLMEKREELYRVALYKSLTNQEVLKKTQELDVVLKKVQILSS